MGKGDRKTTKGKRFNSSYGNSRRHVIVGDGTVVPAASTAARKTVAKAPAKKAVAKKTVAKAS